MEPNRFSDGSSLFSSPNGAAASSRRSPPPRQPNYTCAKVQVFHSLRIFSLQFIGLEALGIHVCLWGLPAYEKP